MKDVYKPLDYDWHHAILEETCPTIIESLGIGFDGTKGANIVHIRKTDYGYKFVELCDEYYGVTLNQEQMERFIKELKELAGINS